MIGYSIRKVRFDELNSCAEVIRRSFGTVAEEFGLTVRNCPTNGAFIKTEHLISDWKRGNVMYGLYCNDQLAGFMELRGKDTGGFELEKLSVLPEHRRRGSGTLLLEHARGEVSRMGGNRITIGIIEENLRLKSWYLSHGFIHAGTANFPHLPFTVGFMELLV